MTGRLDAGIALVARHRPTLTVAGVLLVAAIGFEALRLVLREGHLSDVRTALHAMPPARIAAALGLTTASYLLLTGLDWVALRTVGHPLPWRVAAAGSFTSYTLSHNLGLSLLTGGSARLRLYGAAGLAFGEIAQVAAICGIAFWAGVAGVSGIGLAASGGMVLGPVTLGASAAYALGAVLVALLAALPIVRASGRDTLGFGRLRIALPSLRQMGALGALSLADLTVASAALFVLTPEGSFAAFPAFVVAYAVAVVVALLLHVPGGLGVFETVVLATVPGDRPALFAALLLYRLIYYLLPLLVAAIGIAAAEGWRLRHPIRRGLSYVDRAGQWLAPGAVTVLVFVAGFVLLVSGALPGVKGRLSDLQDLVPLPFIEGSHMAGSLIGTAMLLVAPALTARLRSGWAAARILLVGGAVFSLLKGLDYEEALLQLLVAAVLQYCRASFYREGGILTDRPRWPWLVAAAAALALSIWAGFFSYKRTPYSDDLWWRFALDGNAPRFLRASFAAGVLLTAASAWQLLTASRTRSLPDALPPEAVIAGAMRHAPRTDAALAWTGDKSFVVSAAGDAFLMYRVQGRSWVVMGDPVGPVAAWGELVWSIRRACDARAGRLCFYQASERMLPLFVELGLQAIKYGEEAQVALGRFSMAGPRAKSLRHAVRRTEAAGASFAVEPASVVPGLIADLAAVSDAWLADKAGREKRFSLGAFDPAYLARFPVALVRVEGRIVAFANIWISGDGEEASVDLMRHRPDAPYGTMEMMMVRLIEWARAEGYERFNLGMAPLSGMPSGRLAPLWARLGHAMFANGERIYAFAGLRAFKAKFGPEWVSRYIATPAGAAMPRTLIDLARLVSA
ncbi:bifunctional lysylphosphatidylglycerol flippase/synthetase MprF [Sphingomonas sp. A2-49]|uniref:bifunctional lysylphosphatidylglycerol flippase/synthetase MprF n=1 Tax=Sphingomonas sp. A2-49 TaxID=1391375 RepID=UPI0021CE8460|nr:bifunctional lysylphosphatidylglycerol flippase/synthetase MprF [Sphingomonas sp. A2-49]MCU6455335.1 bifunctional lysylphosphatidylglycerol flippase/synthetase MprF [Sphingomonas sp. A2-49]